MIFKTKKYTPHQTALKMLIALVVVVTVQIEAFQTSKHNLSLVSAINAGFVKAAGKNNLAVVKELLEQKVDIEAQNEEGSTALIDAVWIGHHEMAEVLLENGANLDARNKKQSTALIYAARHGFLDCVKLLLKHGADVDRQDCRGKTALMYAVENTCKEEKVEIYEKIAQALIEKDANLNLQSNEGETALMYATWYGTQDMVELLLKAGADQALQDKQGKTAQSMKKEKNAQLVPRVEDARKKFSHGYRYTKHLIEQMQKRTIALEDLNFVLSYGKVTPDGKKQGVVKIMHADKTIGIIASLTSKVIITAISFINKAERDSWLSKEREEDGLAWLEENIIKNPAPDHHYRAHMPVGRPQPQVDDEDAAYFDDNETDFEIHKFKLGNFIKAYDDCAI